MIGHARAFRSHQQDIVTAKCHVGQPFRRVAAHQQQTAAGGPSFRVERLEIGVAHDLRRCAIIHCRALQSGIGKGESGRHDDVDGHGKTGGEAQDGADIAGDFGLVESDTHGCRIMQRGDLS